MAEVFPSTPPAWLNGSRNAQAAWIRFAEYGKRTPITTAAATRAAALVRYARILTDILECRDAEARNEITARAEYFNTMQRQAYTREQRGNFRRLYNESLDCLRQLDSDLREKRGEALALQRELYPFPAGLEPEIAELLRLIYPIGEKILSSRIGKGGVDSAFGKTSRPKGQTRKSDKTGALLQPVGIPPTRKDKQTWKRTRNKKAPRQNPGRQR